MISWIDDKVAIGDLNDAIYYEMLVEENITEVVDVRVGFNYNVKQNTMSLRFDLWSIGSGWFYSTMKRKGVLLQMICGTK